MHAMGANTHLWGISPTI